MNFSTSNKNYGQLSCKEGSFQDHTKTSPSIVALYFKSLSLSIPFQARAISFGQLRSWKCIIKMLLNTQCSMILSIKLEDIWVVKSLISNSSKNISKSLKNMWKISSSWSMKSIVLLLILELINLEYWRLMIQRISRN